MALQLGAGRFQGGACSRRGRTTAGSTSPTTRSPSAGATSSCPCPGTSRTSGGWGRAASTPRTNHAWTANCVGGGTVHMSGFFYRLKPVDFRMKSMLGAPAGSTVVDWPIRYEDLQPYYEQVEEEIGVSGAGDPSPLGRAAPEALPAAAARRAPHREGDRPGGEEDRRAPVPHRAGHRQPPLPGPRGLHLLHALRQLRLRERREVQHPGCADPARPGHRQRGAPHRGAWPAAWRSPPTVGRRAWCTSTRQDELHEQPAKIVVVSCTAVESARLLLNSRSARWPQRAGQRQRPGRARI